MTLVLRYMRLPDVPQVVTIDHLSFDPPWSARSYSYEVTESTYSHMVVLEQITEKPQRGWRRLLSGQTANSAREVVAYGGLWNVVDEGHISSIASHPAHRGRGFGELTLLGMIQRSITLKASYVVLEVRVSNTVAQQLYHKYHFTITATKKRYYHNNGEDAYEMRLGIDDSAVQTAIGDRFRAIMTRHHGTDDYTAAKPPRAPSPLQPPPFG